MFSHSTDSSSVTVSRKKNARLLCAGVRHRRRVGMLDATHHQDESTRGVRMSRRNSSAQHNREDARGPLFLIICLNPEPPGAAVDLLRIRGDPRTLPQPNIVERVIRR